MKRHLYLPLSLLWLAVWASGQPVEVLTCLAPFRDMRNALIFLSGGMTLTWMSYAMLLAVRPAWLERHLGGLDRLYLEHKWAGVGAVAWLVGHWLIDLSPRILAALDWLSLPARAHHARPQGFSWFALGHLIAQPVAWLVIALGALALLRQVPYTWFRRLHRVFPLAYMLGALHGLLMFRDGFWREPDGFLLALMAGIGIVAGIVSLAGKIGAGRRYPARVGSVQQSPGGVIDLRVGTVAGWPGHRSGQFVLLTLDPADGPHPFTIASAWREGAGLRFNIKPLGDHTRRIGASVCPGDPVIVEGPYGGFDFGHGTEPQLWVAGGIGLTPFLARLEHFAANGGARQPVVMFYSVRSEEELLQHPQLRGLCQRAGVELLIRVENRDGRFQPLDICERLVGQATVWFCGPMAWGRALRGVLMQRRRLAACHFHQERFQFR